MPNLESIEAISTGIGEVLRAVEPAVVAKLAEAVPEVLGGAVETSGTARFAATDLIAEQEEMLRKAQWLRDPTVKASTESRMYAPLMPAVAERYGDRAGLNVLEIGPFRSTALARTLAGNTKLYLGLDCSKTLCQVQQEFLNAEGLRNARSLVGDIYHVPLATGSQDLVFASRTTPLGSVHATRESLTAAYNEISRVLKPDGEFVLFPEPRPEIRVFDPSSEILRKLTRVKIPGTEQESLIIFGKR